MYYVIKTYVNEKKMVIQNKHLILMLNLDITKQLLCGKAYIKERIRYTNNNFEKIF